jgi:hypothetical protein
MRGDLIEKEYYYNSFHPVYPVFYPVGQWLSPMGSFSSF